MITREDFKVKLRDWLSEVTCEKLAFEAEMDFAGDGGMSCYEQMLCLIGSGTEEEFRDNLEDWGIWPQDDDDIEGMFESMESEW